MRAIDLVSNIVICSEQIQKPVTNLRLQKLLYFIQKEAMQKFNEPAFDDDICAWTYGPVIPSVYRAFSHYANTPIIYAEETVFVPRRIKEIIESVVKKYQTCATWKLVDITHMDGSPWSKAIQGKCEVISLTDIANLDN